MSAREVTQAEVDAAAAVIDRRTGGHMGAGSWATCATEALEAAAVVRGDERDALRALIDSEVARAEGAEFAQLRAELDDLRKRLDGIMRWFVETLHYPFDFQFDPAPPIDHQALAEHWRISDGWDVSPEDALACVIGEAGLDAPTPDELEEGQG